MGTKLSKLAKIIQDHPECVIYYDDNGSWSIIDGRDWVDYTTATEEFENSEDDDTEEPEWPDSLYDGADGDGNNGYASPLVEALAELLNITVESI